MSMAAKPKTYAAAQAQARQVIAQARLDDEGEHFPYKHADVIAVLAENAPMGPGVPGGQDGTEDTSRRAEDYITEGIADASRDYVDAQAAYLADGSDENRSAYDAARDRLQAARLDHRRNRGNEFVIGAAAKRS